MVVVVVVVVLLLLVLVVLLVVVLLLVLLLVVVVLLLLLISPAAPPKKCNWINDTDFSGGAYKPQGKGKGMTKEQCCAFCQKDPKVHLVMTLRSSSCRLLLLLLS